MSFVKPETHVTRKPRKITSDTLYPRNGRGIQCPSCGCWDIRVIRTVRLSSTSAIRRERRCRACKHVFHTTERVLE